MKMMKFWSRYLKIAAWHIEYFKLKKFQKMAEAGGHSNHPPLSSPFLPKSGMKPHASGVLSMPRGKEHPYLQKQRDSKRILTYKPCYVFPRSLQLPHTPLTYHILGRLVTLRQT